MTLIPGVEINALVTRDLGLWEGELHILGFGMDPDDEAFEARLAAQRGERRARFDGRSTACARSGCRSMPRSSLVPATTTPSAGRPSPARSSRPGFAASVEDAFSRLIGHGMPGYVPREGLGPEAAIAAIRGAGGSPCWPTSARPRRGWTSSASS